MAWTQITPESLQDVMTEDEWTQFRTAAINGDGATIVSGTIRAVCQRIRGYAKGGNPALTRDSETDTVPPELEDAACVLCLQRLATRMPGVGIVIDEPRQRRIDAANADLKACGGGKFYLTPAGAGLTPEESDEGDYGGDDYIDFGPVR